MFFLEFRYTFLKLSIIMKKVLLLVSLIFSIIPIGLYADFTWPCPSGQVPWENWCISSTSSSNILWVDWADLRNGNVDINTILLVIVSLIRFLLGVAGALSVAALIYHAIKMQLASGITGDSSWVDKAKAGMKGAIVGFVISILGWFIVTRFVEILSSVSG